MPSDSVLLAGFSANHVRMLWASSGFFARRSVVILSMKSATYAERSGAGLALKSFRLIACIGIRARNASKNRMTEYNQNRMNLLPRSSDKLQATGTPNEAALLPSFIWL